ncbi:MAG: hydrogenase expression/formation protein HypE [bacterium]
MSENTSSDSRIIMAHGGGGELTKKLLAEHIIPKLQNPLLNPLDDSAILELDSTRLCMTTDGFVVQPLEFPGGDIGHLAVCGTVNDLAVMGARPKALSLSLVIEEGLPFSMLDRMIDSIAKTAREAGVVICTGDTKVVERGRGDGLTITTTGIGEMREDAALDTARIEEGDAILISGNIAEHGLAIMSVREGLAFKTSLQSDAAVLNGLVDAVLDSGADVVFLRDPTRGGLAGVLVDLVEDRGMSLEVEEDEIPISTVCRHASEMLGLDPLSVANEGKIVAVVKAADADRALKAMRAHPLGKDAALIGRFIEAEPPLCELVTRAGGRRIIQRPYGEDLPRIC